MSRYKIFFIIFLIHFGGLPLCHAQTDTITIIAFGNSTTAIRNTIDSVYAARLPDMLISFGILANVINSGVGGSHTGHLTDNDYHKKKHALDRFDESVMAYHPDIVIIQFGINDSYIDKGQAEGLSRIPLEDYRNNIRQMIRKLKEEGVMVILMSPNAFGSNKEEWRHERLSEYAQVTREIALNGDVIFIDIYRYFEQYGDGTPMGRDKLLLDGVHPNDHGHQEIAKMIADKIIQKYSNTY